MTDTEVADIRSQVFGNGQSPTHTPTPPPTTDTPSAESKLTATVAEPTATNGVPTPLQPITPLEQIVDAAEYLQSQLKDNLGVLSWDEAKAAFVEYNQLKEAAKTPTEIKYANDQSKQLHEAIAAGKTDEVYEILDTQRKLAAVDSMKPAEAIKLHIQQSNRNFKPIDIEDVFEEKYSYPEKPVQTDTEEEHEFKSREDKWLAAKEKVDRRIERDAATAKTALQKLSAELKLPDIPKPAVSVEANEDQQKEIQRIEAETKEAYSKLSTKDIQMVFKFNDEASKLAFDILYEPDKDGFDSAVAEVSDMKEYWKGYYDKDGNPDRKRFLQDRYVAQNIQKIVSEAIVQAVNQERVRALKFQKNIGDGVQRNYNVTQPSETEKLRQAVFGK